ncbi:MAG: hypothetical protein ACR2G3_06385 [Solirubrobacterales bacterium]
MVRARHLECGGETLIRLPRHVSVAAVRHVACAECGESYESLWAEEVEEVAPQPVAIAASTADRLPAQLVITSAPSLPSLPSLPGRLSPPGWLSDPAGRTWRLASIPLAAAAVVGGLLLIQGGAGESATPFAGTAPQAAPAPAAEQGKKEANGKEGSASFVREASFSMALPQGWERTNPSGGATFAATAGAGDADVTLWVERDAELSFSEFEARSLDQLEALAGSAQVTERVAAPTPEGTVLRLAADSPPGSAAYEVTLRAAGAYRYYLATTVQPDASREATEGAQLAHGSFLPAATGDGGGS